MKTVVRVVAILLLLAGQVSICEARVVHVFLVGDIGDEQIGDDVNADLMNMMKVMQEGFQQSKVRFHDTSEMLSSRNALLSGISDAVQNDAESSGNDAIVLYYSGHGEFRAGQGHGFLVQNRSSFIPRSDVRDAMAQLKPALLVLISDTCARKTGPAQRAVQAPFYQDPPRPLFQRLFFEAKGVVDVNACSEGQSAWQLEKLDEDGNRIFGGIFTRALTDTFESSMDQKFGWDVIWSKVASTTAKEFKKQTGGSKEDEFTGEIQTSQIPQRYAIEVSYSGTTNPDSSKNNPGRVPLGLRLDSSGGSVEIVSVQQGSPATRMTESSTGTKMRLEVGDVILSVNDTEVSDHNDAVRLVNQTPRFLKLSVQDHNTGNVYDLEVELRN